VSNGRFVDAGFPGFLSGRPYEFVFMLEIVIGFADPDVSDVYVWVSVELKDMRLVTGKLEMDRKRCGGLRGRVL
jgi:hypothetical protein